MAGAPLQVFHRKKQRGEHIAVISLYDAPTARLCCDAGVDALLVGDSLGNVILGYENTIPVTLDDMVRHTAAVVRGVKQSSRPAVPVIGDLPFGSYHGAFDSVARHGTALMQTGAQALKLEGGNPPAIAAAERLVQMGAPVMGHLGYTPQSALRFQQVVQGKTAVSAMQLVTAARRLEDAGCFSIVLEAIPLEVAARITAEVSIPTIGIGAGPACDGQVLVWHDLAGLTGAEPFRFVKRFAQAYGVLREAARDYVSEVQSGAFPSHEQAWNMAPDELAAWQREPGGTDQRQDDGH